MKAFTDIEQSKKLTKILPIESADMCWTPFDEKWDAYLGAPNPDAIKKEIPCWSLAALLSIIERAYYLTLFHDGVAWIINVISHEANLPNRYYNADGNTPLDACYEMILKLNEQKLL